MSLPHTQSPAALCLTYKVDPTKGLDSAQVRENRRLFGDNGQALAARIATLCPAQPLSLRSFTGRSADTTVGTHPRAIQGSARHHPSRSRWNLIRELFPTHFRPFLARC